MLAATWVGTLLTLLPWGLAADRFGERVVLGRGSRAARLSSPPPPMRRASRWLVAFLGLAGAAGASVNSASGRAVMQWFQPSQRGLALGIRQTAIPAGGLVAALVLPHLGVRSGLLFLAGLCLLGGIAGVLTVREPHEPQSSAPRRSSGRCATASCGSSPPGAASTWSPRSRSSASSCSSSTTSAASRTRPPPVCSRRSRSRRPPCGSARAAGRTSLAAGLSLCGASASPLRWRPGSWPRSPAHRCGSSSPPSSSPAGLSMSWNGLSFTAAAELAGGTPERCGDRLSAVGALGRRSRRPVVFASLVAATSWRAGFALAAVCPLAGILAAPPSYLIHTKCRRFLNGAVHVALSTCEIEHEVSADTGRPSDTKPLQENAHPVLWGTAASATLAA